jgi:hypothetical protein
MLQTLMGTSEFEIAKKRTTKRELMSNDLPGVAVPKPPRLPIDGISHVTRARASVSPFLSSLDASQETWGYYLG